MTDEPATDRLTDQPTPEDRAALDEMLAEGPPASRFPAEVYEAALRMKYALHDDPAIGSEELARDIEVVVSHVLAALEPAPTPTPEEPDDTP